MSLKQKAISGMFWTLIQQFITQSIGFVVSIILARLLLPAEFGLIAMLGIFMGLGTALINSGLTQSLIRTQDTDEEDFSTVFFFNLIGSILIYGIVFVVAPLIANFYNQELLTSIIRVSSVTFIINAFSAIQITRLNKKMDFKTQMKVSIPSLIIGSTVGITMALIGYGVWSLVWSAIIQALAATIQLWYWSKWKPVWVFNWAKFNHHFHYGVKLMFSGILDIIFTNAYTIIIGKFFAPAQVGFYNRADTLQMLPVGNISSIITKVSFPLFATLQKIVFQHIGLDAIVDMILERMGAVEQIVVVGDYANGNDSGTIEVVVIGNDLNTEYIIQLAPKIEDVIKRKVQFMLASRFEGKGLIIYESQE